MTVTQTASFDLSILVQGGSRNFLSLRWNDTEILNAEMADGQMYRPGLTLHPGVYRLELSGSQDWPLDNTIDLVPAAAELEGEPDDRPELARMLPPDQALRGTLGPDNPGYIRFDVPAPGHLWELRGVQGLSDIELIDGNDSTIGRWEAVAGALVLRLALPPGHYTARLRGIGRYAVRLSDKGPVPDGFETEPNDTETAAIRLAIGQKVTGDLQNFGDSDFYEFLLAAPTPLKITVTGPDDGPIVADIFTADAGMLRAELPLGAVPVSYAAVYPAGRYLIQIRARENGVSGQYTLEIGRTSDPEPNEPNGASAMPGDGIIVGQIGGFDTGDHIFLPLPEGSGHFALACQGSLQFWEVWTYGDEVRLLRAEPGQTAVLPFGPELGGALALWAYADPQDPSGAYDCRMRFAPVAAASILPTTAHDEALDDQQPTSLTPGLTVTGQSETDRDRDRITLDAPPGHFVGLHCDIPVDRLRIDHPFRSVLEAPALPGDIRPFLAGPEPLTLDIAPPADAVFPHNWSCSLLEEPAFSTPALAGPVANFTGFADPQADPAQATGFLITHLAQPLTIWYK